MATGNKFYQFVEDRAHGVHNFNSHTIKMMLSNTVPLATNEVAADITEIAAGNGYTAGGFAMTKVSSEQTLGVYKVIYEDKIITASGGTMASFRYLVFYNDTPTSPADPLIVWYDIGSPISLADGQSYLVDVSAVNGLFQDQ